ncbi:MAG: DNA polymerase Y family protein [Alphaproteobacteria bacterium]|nr:DNA polymerase Y family protein [Alphaproteobacteria bacterium]
MPAHRFLYIWLPLLATDRYIRRPPPDIDARLDQVPFAVTEAIGGAVRLLGVNRPGLKIKLHTGMPLADARAIHPGLITLPARRDGDRSALVALSRWADRYSPWAAAERRPEGVPDYGDGGVWLNITGCAHLFGGEADMAAAITRQVAGMGFETRLGLADTPGGAWAAARYHPESGHIPPGKTREVAADFPVRALRLSEESADLLARLGLHRIADLYPLPRANLTARAGGDVLRRLDQLLGRLPEHLFYNQPPRLHSVRRSWPEPLIDGTGLRDSTRHLLEQLCLQLREEGLGIRQLAAQYRRVDDTISFVTVGTSLPTVAVPHLFRLLEDRLTAVDPGFGIEESLIWARRVEPLKTRQTDLENDTGTPDKLALGALLDRLGHRLGGEALYRPGILPGHRPDRLFRKAGLTPPGKAQKGGADGTENLPPRPLRFFARPETAAVDLGPDNRLPDSVTWRRMTFPADGLEGPERLWPEWWQALDRSPVEGLRDYYRVPGPQGRRLWLCREQTSRGDQWSVQGLFS